jgi:hypothetical protein
MQILSLTLALFLGTNAKRIPVREQVKKPVVKDHNYIDYDNSWEDPMCSTATDRLEDGPAVPGDYSSTNVFTDTTFEGEDQLYWEGFSSGEADGWVSYMNSGRYEFLRIPEFSATNPLFDSDGPHWNDV